MPIRRTLILSPEEQRDLEHIRDHDRRAYLRERAAALLKIAQGRSAHWVACFGLLKPRQPDTVYGWLNEYEQSRRIRPRPPCRGRFSPSGPGAAEPVRAPAPGT